MYRTVLWPPVDNVGYVTLGGIGAGQRLIMIHFQCINPSVLWPRVDMSCHRMTVCPLFG